MKLIPLSLFILLFSCKMPPYPCDTPLARLSNIKFFSAADCGREGNHHVLFVVWQQTDKEIDWLYFTGQQWSTNWSDALMIDDADSCKLKKIYRQWERSQMLDRDRWDSIHNVVPLPAKDTIGGDATHEHIIPLSGQKGDTLDWDTAGVISIQSSTGNQSIIIKAKGKGNKISVQQRN